VSQVPADELRERRHPGNLGDLTRQQAKASAPEHAATLARHKEQALREL
jgi:hypothetical protein